MSGCRAGRMSRGQVRMLLTPSTQRQDPDRNLGLTFVNSLHVFLHPFETTATLSGLLISRVMVSNMSDALFPGCSASFSNSYSASTVMLCMSGCLSSRIPEGESQPVMKAPPASLCMNSTGPLRSLGTAGGLCREQTLNSGLCSDLKGWEHQGLW